MDIITIILLITIILVIGYIIYLYYINSISSSVILPSSSSYTSSPYPSSPYIDNSDRPIAQIGERCGGNMTNAKICANGLKCSNISSPRLIGDIGGICIKN